MNSFGDWLSSLQGAAQSMYSQRTANIGGVGANRVPALWLAFSGQGEGLINREYSARKRALQSAAGLARGDYARNLGNTYQSAGLDQLFAQRQLAETVPNYQYQVRQGINELEGTRLADLLSFRTGISNALADSATSERQLSLQDYWAKKARESTERVGRLSAIASGFPDSFSIF
jgi:hypothetical protein